MTSSTQVTPAELRLPGWRIIEYRTHDIGGAELIRVQANHGGNAEFHVAWRLSDDNPVTRDMSFRALATALCRFEADPSSYFHAQYAYAQSRDARY